MSFLTWHTRGRSSAMGKARLWLCVHPEECDKYLHPVSEHIYDINHHDWAVWYDQKPLDDISDDFFKNLSRMELFVVPVTEKLLTEPNRAMDVEIPFAIEHHIPVLPLIMEKGLIEKFNERFHKFQYIDASGERFAEKLRNYLSKILIEGELIDQVKGNFAKRIFLSYRKLDKRFVPEIMSGIHQHSGFRRFSIWFDDFLNPGENFGSQILENIHICDAAVLLVTPNILQEGNYVLTREYVELTQLGKFVLPIEAVETDDEYFEKYPTLQKAISLDRTEDIYAALKSVLGETDAFAETPEENYLYGLAYLNGINVEKNYTYALEFLERAAEENHIPAIEKLCDMYTEGHGVAASYRAALHWAKKAADCYAAVYETLPSEENVDPYVTALRSYAIRLTNAGMNAEALQAHLHRVAVCEEIVSRFPDVFGFKRDLCEVYGAISQSYIGRDEYDLATEYLEKAQKIGAILDADEGGDFNAYNTAANYAILGQIYRNKADNARAMEFYQKAVHLAQKIVFDAIPRVSDPALEEKNESFLPLDLEMPIIHLITTCWMSLGDMAVEEENMGAAKYYYHDAESSLVGFSAGHGDLKLLHSTLLLFSKLLELYAGEGNQHFAEEYCQRIVMLCTTAKEDSWYPSLLLDGISFLRRIEQTCDKYALPEKKREAEQQEVALWEYLFEKTNAAEHLQQYCHTCGRYAAGELDSGNAAAANSYCRKAIEMLELRGDVLPAQMKNDYLYRMYSQISDGLVSCGELQAALAYCEQSLVLCQSGELPDAMNRSVDVCWGLCALYDEMGQSDKALEYLQNASTLCEEILKQEPSVAMKRKMSILLEKGAAFCMEKEDKDTARNFMAYSASLSNEVFQEQQDAQSFDDMLHATLCMTELQLEDSAVAEPMKQAFLLLIQSYSGQFDSIDGSNERYLGSMVEKMLCAETYLLQPSSGEILYEVLTVYSTINDLCARRNMQDATEKTYGRILELGEMVLEADATNANVHRILCHANKLMAQLLERMGERESATECYENACRNANAYYDASAASEAVYELAEIYNKLGGLYVETDAEQASAYYQEAMALFKKLIASNGEIYEKHNYATTGIQLGKLYAALGKQTQALEVYGQLIAFLETDSQMQRDYPRMLAIVLEKKGDIHREEKSAEWMTYYQQSLDIFRKIYEAAPDAQSAHDLEIITERVARCLRLSGNKAASEEYYLQLEKVQERLFKMQPSLQYLKKRKNTVAILAEIYEERGDIPSSITYFEKLINLCESIRQNEPTEQAWFEYAVALQRVAMLRKDRYWLQQALRIFESLQQQTERPEVYGQIIAELRRILAGEA